MSLDWNVGVQDNKGLRQEEEKAVLVGIVTFEQPEEQVIEYLDELEFLAHTAGARTLQRFIQKLDRPDSRTYIRKGKVEEVRQYVVKHEIDLVIFDDDLTGKQTNILEETFRCKILDRSSLILDIFAGRAQTARAKTQVELAQMQYLLPRLRGLWTHLERQRGGIGMRGPGEKEIETDRRIVRDKIALLKDKLQKIDKQSQTQRKNRGAMVRASLVGYTNAGKSTLMNQISKSQVLAEDKLFATLDTTVRKVVIDRMPFLLSDTVGFIRKLPTHLIESFKSTLDEVRESDILLHIVDISHPQYRDHIEVVNETLQDIGAGDKPMLYVFNKIDRYQERYFDAYLEEEVKYDLLRELERGWLERTDGQAVFTSAVDKKSLDVFFKVVFERVDELYKERYPYKTRFW